MPMSMREERRMGAGRGNHVSEGEILNGGSHSLARPPKGYCVNV